MPKIISLEKKKRLYKVVFDDERTIYVTEDTIVRFFLSKGAVFENAEIEKISEFADFSRGKSLGLYYISFKQRTKKEVIRYLIDHEIPNVQIAKIIDALEASRFIDDPAYAESFPSFFAISTVFKATLLLTINCLSIRFTPSIPIFNASSLFTDESFNISRYIPG